MRYPEAVRRHFDQPRNVGPLTGASARVCHGEAGTAASGTWIVIEADVVAGRIVRLAFRAFGCPYVIAACSRVTELLTEASVNALASFDVQALARELEVPAERLGRLLVLEDALRNCFRDWDTTRPDGVS